MSPKTTRAPSRANSRYVETGADPHHLLHLLDGLGEHRDERDLPVGGEPVALVGPQVLLGVEHRGAGEDAVERFEQAAFGGSALRIVRRHVHRVHLPVGAAYRDGARVLSVRRRMPPLETGESAEVMVRRDPPAPVLYPTKLGGSRRCVPLQSPCLTKSPSGGSASSPPVCAWTMGDVRRLTGS